jgi:hypothetical protein
VFAVVLGLCALAVGPVLGPVLRRFSGLAAGVDAFVVVTVTGLVVLHVLPQSVALGGVVVLPLAGAGVVVPALLHRFDAVQRPALWRGGRQVLATLFLLCAAFGHALLDGVALIDGDEAHGHGGGHDAGLSALAVAVLLHRLPYGLALWLNGRERLGRGRALAVLGALAAGTVVGAVVGDQLLTPSTARAFALVQAFAAGAVLHVLLEAPAVDVSGGRRASFFGVAAGAGVLVVLTRSHPMLAVVAGELDFSSTLLAFVGLCGPSVFCAFAFVAVLGRLLDVVERRVRGGVIAGRHGPETAAAMGVFLAALASLCGCRVGHTFESLLRRRAAVAGAVALLVAAPHLEMVQALLSWALLGPGVALSRIAGAVVVALVAGVVVSVVAGRDSSPAPGAVDGELALPSPGPRATLVAAVEHALPWLLLGVVLAAFLEPLVTATGLVFLRGVSGVVIAAALGAPIYLCGPAAMPVAAVLLHKGGSAGAVVAFLLSAPAMNVTTLGLLARLVSRRAAAVLAVVVVGGAVVVGVVVDAMPAAPLQPPPLHPFAQTAASDTTVSVVAGLLVALLAWSVARQGARGFLAQILAPLDDAKGGHLHGPHCGHPEHARAGFGKRTPVARVVVHFAVDDPRPIDDPR